MRGLSRPSANFETLVGSVTSQVRSGACGRGRVRQRGGGGTPAAFGRGDGDHLVTERLELAHLVDEHRVPEMQIRRSDRLASLGTLSAGMAHEMKNPLVSIKTFAQLLPERYQDSDFRETFYHFSRG